MTQPPEFAVGPLPSTRVFLLARLRSQGRGWLELRKQLAMETLPRLTPADVRLWGAWFGLFGLHSNELLVLTSWPEDAVGASGQFIDALPSNTEVVDVLELVATVRPLDDEEQTRDGLYVFRFFDVLQRDVEEIAVLSAQGWTTFENTDAYATSPRALFCQRDRSETRGRMLLLTWYDGLESWQLSRGPAPGAPGGNPNFRRRAELTSDTVAYATRLAR